MELRPISDLAGWYARELSEAFPENERKPLADMVSEMERGCYEPLGLYEGQALLGYATLWSREAFPGYVLLDYLGVTAGRRNGGLGAAILRLLGERYGGPPGHLRPRAPRCKDPAGARRDTGTPILDEGTKLT